MVASPTADVTSTQPDAEVDEDDLEREQDDPQEEITEPFDPELIRINTRPVVVEQVVTRVKQDELDLAPEFQRLRGIWDSKRKSRLIESLLLRIPIPVFYVAADEEDRWSVVDGVQRISTIYDYVTGHFPLTKLEYLTWLDKCDHDSLPRKFQRRISETQLSINVIEPGTPAEVMFNVFLRINTGGMTLNGQEIRHALNPGPVRDYLKDLAQSDEFLKATDDSISVIRMADRECVLRFLAFHIEPWEEYSDSDLDSHLGSIMRKLNSMSSAERNARATDFKRAMRAAFRIFGGEAFRKPPGEHNRRRPVNRALLETWSVRLARCSPEQLDVLADGREDVRRRFYRLLLQDGDFERSISYSTGSPQRVRKRFQAIDQLVEEFI